MREIFVDLDRCNGCLMCVQACAAEHSTSKTIPGALLEGTPARIFVHLAKGRPVPVTCRHCEEPACVDACMSGAMQKDKATGIVSNEGHDQECVGCWMCIMACPYGAIVQDHSGPQAKALKCDRCRGKEPACVAACPNNALVFVEPDEFALQRRQKEAVKMLQAV